MGLRWREGAEVVLGLERLYQALVVGSRAAAANAAAAVLPVQCRVVPRKCLLSPVVCYCCNTPISNSSIDTASAMGSPSVATPDFIISE